jgi:flagellar hook-associated protein 1 FlgK
MSIDSIMRSALSGLNANQTALRTTSNNISNVNTPGFAREEVTFRSRSIAGASAGVEIGEIRQIVDQFLTREFVSASARLGYYDTQNDLFDRLQSMLGGPDLPSSLHNLIDQAFGSLSSLAVEPSQMPRRVAAVADIQALGEGIDRLARQIQVLREEADRRMQSEIASVNSALQQIHNLNQMISQQKAVGEGTGSLEQQRQAALEKISSAIDVRAVQMGDGILHVSTISGVTLIDAQMRQLQYTAPGQIDTSSTFDSITVNKVDPDTGTVAATGEALDARLRSGTIRGLIDMRDKELPDAAIALGELSAHLVDEFNKVHNNYSTVPAPNTLTGRNVGALATDAHGFTGKATFAVLDANNEISDSYTIDFSNVGLVTLQDVINDVNANLTGATVSLSNGVMTFDATAGTDGVAIQQDPTTPSARAGRGFAHFFGMNDLLGGRYVREPQTGLTTTSAHGFGASGTVSIEFRGPGGVIADSHTLDFSAIGGTMTNVLSDLNTAFSGYASFALDSNGELTVTPASGYEDFDMAVRNDSTSRGATSVSFSEFFGVGDRYRMDAAFSVSVKQSIQDDQSGLASAYLDLAAAAGTPALNVGDNRGASALFGLADTSLAFVAAGDLPSLSATLSDYAGYYLSSIGMEADRIESLAEDRRVLADAISNKRDSVSGVNLDEELANMVVYQNAYNAAARLITTANQMFETLLSVAG